MEGKTIRNIQSTQQNLLASRHFPPFSVLLISCPSSQTSVEFYANDHWAASSHLTTGNMYCFSRWGLSFLHTPINEQIRMYSFTIIHFLSKLGLCFLHTHTHTHIHTYACTPHSHTHAYMHAHMHTPTKAVFRESGAWSSGGGSLRTGHTLGLASFSSVAALRAQLTVIACSVIVIPQQTIH